jgi:hypothetical protein
MINTLACPGCGNSDRLSIKHVVIYTHDKDVEIQDDGECRVYVGLTPNLSELVRVGLTCMGCGRGVHDNELAVMFHQAVNGRIRVEGDAA